MKRKADSELSVTTEKKAKTTHLHYNFEYQVISFTYAKEIAEIIKINKPTKIIFRNCTFNGNCFQIINSSITSYNSLEAIEVSNCYKSVLEDNKIKTKPFSKYDYNHLFRNLISHTGLKILKIDLKDFSEQDYYLLNPIAKLSSLTNLDIINSRISQEDLRKSLNADNKFDEIEISEKNIIEVIDLVEEKNSETSIIAPHLINNAHHKISPKYITPNEWRLHLNNSSSENNRDALAKTNCIKANIITINN